MIAGGTVTLGVREVAQAVRFYIETLGMKLVSEGDGLAVIDAGEGFLVALRQGTPSKTPITFFAKVPLSEAVAIYENRGITFRPDGKAFAFEDPDGNALCLAEKS